MLRQASLSCKSAKEELLKSLTDIKVDTRANRICGIVLKAKKIVKPTISSTSLQYSYGNINMKSNALIFQLKNLIFGEKPGCNIAEKIVIRLEKIIQDSYCKHDLSDKPERVLNLLLEVNNSKTLKLKYKNPEEYLTHLITATNCFVSSYGGRSIYPPHTLYPPFPLHPADFPGRYLKILFRIQRSLLISTSYKAQELLYLVFQIGRVRSDFSEEEKREIGTLLVTALQPIKTCMRCTSCFSHCRLSTLLHRRSALQFLLDDYATFPAGNGALLADFYGDKMKASIKSVDNLIRVWCDYLGEGEVDEKEVGDRVLDSDMIRWYEKENDLKEAGASEVPESHTWWADSIKKCLTKDSRSCKASKEKLLKSLADIKVDNCANRICGIVLKAKKIVNPSMSTTSLKCSYGNINLKTIALIFQLKSLIVEKEPGFNLAEKIAKRLEQNIQWSCTISKPDLSDQLESVLKLLSEVNSSETLNLKYKNPEEYLTHLITATNCRDDGSFSYSRYPADSPARYRENLFKVRRSLLKHASYKVGDLLCSISLNGRARSDFSEEEKRKIGTSMIAALQPIKTCMKGISCFSRCKLSTLLQRRSALQFILDDYATFPVGNGAILADFYEDKINVSVKSIDSIIRVWCDYLGEGEVDKKEVGDRVLDNDMSRWYEEENDVKEAGAPGVPESHTWWADSIKKCITEASRSCKPLKDQLVKRLKDIRVDPIAFRFCGLISKAKNVTKLSRNASSPKYYGDINLRTDPITYELKNLIAGDKPELNLAKMLVARLKNVIKSTKNISNKSKCVLQLLLEIENSESLNLKYRNSEEYLNHLISKFVNQEKLNEAQYYLAGSASYKCEELLTIIFQISRARSDFSEEEKRAIGTLMIGALQPIETYMNGINCFSGYKLSSLLQHRSALQFLLDDYATFPVGNGVLLKDFYEDKINASIRSIDNLIRIWCNYLGRCGVDEKEVGDFRLENDMDEWLKDEISFDEAGAYEVPESHTWWADSIKKCIIDSYTFDNAPDFRAYLAGTKDNEILTE